MDREGLLVTDGTTLVDGLTNDIDDSAKSLGTDGNLDGVTSVHDGLTSDETLGGVQSDGTHVVSTQMLGDLENETVVAAFDLEGIENRGKCTFELDVDDGANDLGNFSGRGAESTYT